MLNNELLRLLKRFFGLDPTSNQSEAITQLVLFTESKEMNPVFLLSGYAGTGKTTLMGAYIKALNALEFKSCLLAPTGRAAKVLAMKSESKAQTIHKKIYFKNTIPGEKTQLVLAQNLHTNTVFIVDEASMIGDFSVQKEGVFDTRNLLEDLIEYVFSGVNCKLIFVGDKGQLPPVGSDFSPALDPVYLKTHFFRVSVLQMQLKEVVRQSFDSAILANATKLRNVEEFEFPIIDLFKNSDVIRVEGGDLQEELEAYYNAFSYDDVIVITKSNKRANAYNHHIRTRILCREEIVCAGDRLMIVRNNYFWLEADSPAGFIANGEIVKVNRIRNVHEIYGFKFVNASVELVDYQDMGEIDVVLMLNTLDSESPSLSREDMKTLFFEIEKEYADERNTKKRYERILKNPYFNALQVKYAYAITCHKAQGGQWPIVFLDHDYLTEEMLNFSFLRWLYTGFTRASEKLFLVNFHKEFFENEIDE
jgi:exodeoxyribonuclease-5